MHKDVLRGALARLTNILGLFVPSCCLSFSFLVHSKSTGQHLSLSLRQNEVLSDWLAALATPHHIAVWLKHWQILSTAFLSSLA